MRGQNLPDCKTACLYEDVTWELGCAIGLEVCDFGVKLMQVCPTVGETGQTLQGPTYESRWPEKTIEENPRCARSQTVQTSEYSCSLELEPHCFLIVHAVVRHNVGGGDCMTACGS